MLIVVCSMITCFINGDPLPRVKMYAKVQDFMRILTGAMKELLYQLSFF